MRERVAGVVGVAAALSVAIAPSGAAVRAATGGRKALGEGRHAHARQPASLTGRAASPRRRGGADLPREGQDHAPQRVARLAVAADGSGADPRRRRGQGRPWLGREPRVRRRGRARLRRAARPFAVESYDLEGALLDAGIADPMLDDVERLGLVGLGVLPGPLRKVLGVSKALTGPSDFAGTRVGLQPLAGRERDASRARSRRGHPPRRREPGRAGGRARAAGRRRSTGTRTTTPPST